MAAEVTCVGIAVLDRVYRVDHHATAPGKHRALERTVVGGGVAANAAVTVARLGGTARFIGALGDDETGAWIRADLEREGVATSGIRTMSRCASPESIVQIDHHGERIIVNHASADLFETAEPPGPDDFATSDAVLVDMRWPRGAVAALRAARRRGVPGVVDCDHDPADSPGILDEASHIVFAAPTLLAWTAAPSVEEGLQTAQHRTGAWVAATEGAAGTTWWESSGPVRVPAFEVDAVDTLGAGDVFHGAFALRLAEGATHDDAIRFASAAAAVKCQRFGGRAGIPDRSEVEAFLEERWS